MKDLKEWQIICYLPKKCNRSFSFDVRDMKEWRLNGEHYEQARKEDKLCEYFIKGLKFKTEIIKGSDYE